MVNYELEISTDINISDGAFEPPEQLSGIIPGSLENPDIPVIGIKPADSGREVFQGEIDEKQVLNSIVRQARFMYQKGSSSAVINLEPPNLGRMKLDIITENSKVTGRIIVESAEVKQLIQNSISELRENLAQSGMKVESFDVQVGHNSGSEGWANRENLEKQLNAQQKSAVFSGNVSDPNMQPNIENKPIRTTSLYCEILDVRI